MLTVPVGKFRLATSRAGARALIDDALRAVGLRPDEMLGRFPHQLSGGQRQRVMVARALLLRPRVIVADEPVSMVDASLRATILGSLRQMTLDLQIPVIYITHDLATAYQIAENIMVMYRGDVVEAGDVEQVVKDPRHPYTRLLVGSIPLPGTERTWTAASARPRRARGLRRALRAVSSRTAAPRRCRRAGRPRRLYRIGTHRAAACFLYQDAPRFRRTRWRRSSSNPAWTRDRIGPRFSRLVDVGTRAVLVTGSGRIGRAVCGEPIARGHRVRGFDRVPSSAVADSVVGNAANPDDLARALEGIDTAVHLAATPDEADFLTHLLPDNVVGLYRMLEAARHARLARHPGE